MTGTLSSRCDTRDKPQSRKSMGAGPLCPWTSGPALSNAFRLNVQVRPWHFRIGALTRSIALDRNDQPNRKRNKPPAQMTGIISKPIADTPKIKQTVARATGSGMTDSIECRYYGHNFTTGKMMLPWALTASGRSAPMPSWQRTSVVRSAGSSLIAG